MSTRKVWGALLGAATILTGPVIAPQAMATPVAIPAWSIQSLSMPTNFQPGDQSGTDEYQIFITNSGGRETDGSKIILTDTLPAGLGVHGGAAGIKLTPPRSQAIPGVCEVKVVSEISTVTCEITNALAPGNEPTIFSPGNELLLQIPVTVSPNISGSLVNRVEVTGGNAATKSLASHNQASNAETPAGFEEFHSELTGVDGLPVTGADSHPYQYTTTIAVNTVPAPPGSSAPFLPAGGDLRDIEVALPPGLVGNPNATERCTAQQFNTIEGEGFGNTCPAGSVVGVAAIQQLEGQAKEIGSLSAIYNLVPPRGMPAQFGFQPVVGVPVYIDTKLRSGSDYGITAFLPDVTEAERVSASRVTLWGIPGDHQSGGSANPETAKPFLRLPSSCEGPLSTVIGFDTWALPSNSAGTSVSESALTGCAQPDFSPSVEAGSTTGVADSPSGLHFDLHLPQVAHEEPEGVSEADLKDATVTLPEGLLVNPSSADGLAGCSEQQVGYEGVREDRQAFSAQPAECPDASKIGTVRIDTPLIDHPLPGAVYLAKQDENPFGSLLAIYITVHDPQSGIVVKLPGKVEPDPVTGQLRTTVSQSPQTPFEDLHLDFFEGARAPLRTPATCGTFSTTTSLVPWTSPEGSTATPSGAFQVTSSPAGGGACPSTPAGEPNTPGFEAGTTNPVAGAYSPLVVHLTREDGSQNFSGLNVTLPPGATGKLAGIPQCSEAQIAAAQARSHPGAGTAEQANPSCPASSLVGTATVGAGAGPNPLYVTGKAYLAGPYEGAPFSLEIITPAVAGPFDLGTVVVRAGLYINPSTAQVTTKSDPIPSILQGIPLDVRSITVNVDRPGFILNPTSCNPLTVTGEETSTLGQTVPLSGRFQVGACQNLKFTPKLTVSTTGATSKAKGASLSVKVAYPTGSLGAQTNIGRVDLQLPKQLPARLSTLQKACTEAQFNTNPADCPTASMIGTAKAITPLLSSPLTGPAILVSHGGAAFPDVEFLLQGEGVLVILDGKTQIKNGITYSRFETVPDQPISTFETTFPEGPYSVLATDLPASAKSSLCGQNLTLPTILTAQNGTTINQNTKATITGCTKTKTLTRAQKLTLALKTCHKKHGAKRKACERQARKQYGPLRKTKRTKKK